MWTYTKEWAFRTILSFLILKMMTIYYIHAKYSLQKLYVVSYKIVHGSWDLYVIGKDLDP